MKTIYYILIALFMTASVTSCTADSIADSEDVFVEESGNDGSDGTIGPEDTAG